MRVLITEDMPMFREIVATASRTCGHEVVAETESAIETVRLCRTLLPDLLFLDVRLPDGDGLSVAQIVRSEFPAIRIIMVTAYTTAFFIDRLAQAAVDGFIDKNVETSHALEEAFEALTRGEKWYSATFRRMRQQQSRDPSFFGKLLTPREQIVLGLVGHSFSNEQIAARLGMSVRTVEDHRSNLLHKLQLDGTPKLIAFANANGFTPIL
jgi:two-component system nitrate/nitrite response regulator NarL